MRPFPHTPFPQCQTSLASLGRCDVHQILDEAEHFRDNQKASVATLRSVIGIIPECRSPSSGTAFAFSGIRTRDEFRQQIWNGSTFVDFDHGLDAAVNRLRQALGDSADEPR